MNEVSCRETLRQGLIGLALDVDTAKQEKLISFIQLLAKWNKAYNLTAVRDIEAMVSMHVLDSLTVLPYLKSPRIADIGTGAGLPGIPLAIYVPESSFVLVDSNAKKTRFVRQVVMELQLNNVEVVHGRVEAFRPVRGFSTVVTRAFANMAGILKLTTHLLVDEGVLLAMKGRPPAEAELVELPVAYSVIPLKTPGVDAERCLVRVEMQKHG